MSYFCLFLLKGLIKVLFFSPPFSKVIRFIRFNSSPPFSKVIRFIRFNRWCYESSGFSVHFHSGLVL